MTQEKLAKLVKKRAHANVQKKLKHFNSAMRKAFSELTGAEGMASESTNKAAETNYNILAMALDEQDFHPANKWPRWLWEQEEEKVMTEILSTMDTMQKALAAPEIKDTDCQPAD